MRSLKKSLMAIAVASSAMPLVAQDMALEEVIVTAQKRAQNVQDIPVTINVVDGSALDSFSIRNTNDLADSVPGLTIQHTPQNLSNISMRGLGTGAGQESYDQSVGLFIDGVWAGRIREFQAALFDVERIEVIKGTQNSLLGKNTSLGAINVLSRRPGDTLSGYVQADYEVEFESVYATAAVDIPTSIGNFRIAVNQVNEEGYVSNQTTGNKVPEREQSTVRLGASFEFGDNGDLWLSYQYDDLSILGDTFQVVADDAGLIASMDPTAEVGLDDSKTAWTSFSDHGDANDEQDAQRAVADYQHSFGEYTVNSLTAFSEYDNERNTDSDFINVDYLNTAYTSEYQQFSQEFRLASPAGQTFEYVAGLFYLNSELEYTNTTEFAFPPPFTIGPLPLDGETLKTYDQDTEVWSVFGQGTFNFSEDWRLTLGLRYTDEEKEVVWGNEHVRPAVALFIISPPVDPTPLNRTEDNLDGSINLQYDFDDQVMGYASWARGSKSGGFALSVASPDDAEYDTEEAETTEVGLKMSLADGAALLNLSGFYTEIDNFQVVTFIGTGFLTSSIPAETYGAEFEGQWAVSPGFLLGASATLAHAEEVDTGLRLPQAPKWSASVNARYDYELGSSDLLLRTEAVLNHRDEQYQQAGERSLDGPLTLLNLRLALMPEAGNWELALMGRNLLDQVSSFGFTFPIFGDEDTPMGSLNRPRTVAIQARYNF
jgi:iron complex outermembrane recepter protein